MIKKVFKVSDMHCANCAMKIEAIEDDLPGVRRVEASYHRGEVLVVFDEARTNEAAILEAIRGQGYTPSVSTNL